MSFTSGQRQFTIGIYAQSGLAMDWFGLTDPFTQTIPLKVANTYSGSLWFQGQLNSPPSGYSSYSGITLGLVNSGANATLSMTWSRGVSGWIASSSPITESLTLGLIAFTSSNYTGAIDSGTLSFSNVLFNRYSGVIKVFGDIYSNNQPTPTVTTALGAGFVSGQTMSYAVSYILSGWESDIGVPGNAQAGNPSGANQIVVSWSSIIGVSQYLLWRWSGSTDFTIYSGASAPNGGMLRPMDLIQIGTGTSLTDTGVAAIQSSMFRHRTWSTYSVSGTADNTLATADSNTFLSSPQSRLTNVSVNRNVITRPTHGYQLNKNVSGTSLLGPFYMTFHWRNNPADSNIAVYLNNSIDGSISGTSLADAGVYSLVVTSWYRNTIFLGALSSSGTVHVQTMFGSGGITSGGQWIDDVFVVAFS